MGAAHGDLGLIAGTNGEKSGQTMNLMLSKTSDGCLVSNPQNRCPIANCIISWGANVGKLESKGSRVSKTGWMDRYIVRRRSDFEPNRESHHGSILQRGDISYRTKYRCVSMM